MNFGLASTRRSARSIPLSKLPPSFRPSWKKSISVAMSFSDASAR
jgi:hypothetical protein